MKRLIKELSLSGLTLKQKAIVYGISLYRFAFLQARRKPRFGSCF